MASIIETGAAGEITLPAAPRRRKRKLSTDGWWPWAFVLPSFVGIVIFAVWPILRTIYMSFTEAGPFGGEHWVGLANYITMLTDPNVGWAILNSLEFTGIGLLGIPISMVLASIIGRPGFRLARFYRVLFFLPFIAMPVAITLVWRMIFNGNFGIVNQALALVGIKGPYWLSTPGVLIVVISLIGVWGGIGFNMIVLSAGLKSIPADYYEAAELDGASKPRQFFSITVPLVSPTVFFLVVMQIIGGFQVFTALYVMMGNNNPQMAKSQTLVYLFYNQGFTLNHVGYAASIAVLILVIIGVITAAQFVLQKKWVFQ
ncbi:carbohydrate ABC transporter permease [Humibacter ginsenosidimutans]|uniref:Sugar ABC transporter permease n=1 Tax=Humibacter ginsenosidimutans TaxID=2599293 RepID=A0A5B8M0I9_9MICO|nr:sugar ABC transporter permease [Humibacter ginsenosidimutans]QDZ14187.1 sugar ABC transporter permease [Humibacter ginsenosidimutans]